MSKNNVKIELPRSKPPSRTSKMLFRSVWTGRRRLRKSLKRLNISLKTLMRSRCVKGYCSIDSGQLFWSVVWIVLWLNIATLRKAFRKSDYRQTTRMSEKLSINSWLRNKLTHHSWSLSMRMSKNMTNWKLLMIRSEIRCKTWQWYLRTVGRSRDRHPETNRPH